MAQDDALPTALMETKVAWRKRELAAGNPILSPCDVFLAALIGPQGASI